MPDDDPTQPQPHPEPVSTPSVTRSDAPADDQLGGSGPDGTRWPPSACSAAGAIGERLVMRPPQDFRVEHMAFHAGPGLGSFRLLVDGALIYEDRDPPMLDDDPRWPGRGSRAVELEPVTIRAGRTAMVETTWRGPAPAGRDLVNVLLTGTQARPAPNTLQAAKEVLGHDLMRWSDVFTMKRCWEVRPERDTLVDTVTAWGLGPRSVPRISCAGLRVLGTHVLGHGPEHDGRRHFVFEPPVKVRPGEQLLVEVVDPSGLTEPDEAVEVLLCGYEKW